MVGGNKVKKIVLVALLIFAMSSMAMASPLTDYSKGNAALDINYRNSSTYDVNAGINGTPLNGGISFDGKHNYEWGFTYGIGNNWALQYRQATPKGTLNLIDFSREYVPEPDPGEVGATALTTGSILDGVTAVNVNLEAKTRVEEYNILYKLDKNFSLFTGIVKATPSLKASAGVQLWMEDNYSGDLAIQGHDKNIWQFGFIASAPIADKLTAYGLASFGSDYRNWEAGLGYEIAKNLELNVNYRDMKIDNMTVAGLSTPSGNHDIKTDTKVKGWGFGVTYKF
jgi:opacity protein-like surface antigen